VTVPRQNRVTPFGDLVAVPERGTFMGNRGCLHDAEGRIKRPWQLKRWIVCVLEFRGRKRTVMTPGFYTELFFLDEATAFASGHRPCAECRRERFNAYRDAWKTAHSLDGRPSAVVIDERLHEERVSPDRVRRTFVAPLDELPDGVFVADGSEGFLVWGDRLLKWTPAGYVAGRPRPAGGTATVLTPASTVAVLRAGYVPAVHESVR
jgi:hypothetical protein